MTMTIEARGLVKHFDGTTALDGVDLDAPAGSILGVLGPNGSGKTTTVRILATLLRPDAGSVTVAGYDALRDPVSVRGLIGLTGQYASADEELTGVENLEMIGRLLEMPTRQARARARELISRFDLTEAGKRPVKTYSGGMRRRIDLAASLVGRPQVIYLDEPTTGLDPRSREELWRIVRELSDEGTTILLTTQYLEEADQLADQVSVLDQGKVVAEGAPAELKRRVGAQTLRVLPTNRDDTSTVAAILAELSGREPAVSPEHGLVTVPTDDPVMLSAVIRRLDNEAIEADEVALRLPSLDSIFLALTGHPAEAPAVESTPTAPEKSPA